MQAPKTKTLDTTSTPEALFGALLGSVQTGKYKILGLSNEQRKLVFTSGKTALSWGQEYIAEVHVADGRTSLKLLCGGVDGRPKALLDPWKNGKAADKVLTAVKEALADPSRAAAQPMESFATLGDGSIGPWVSTNSI